MQRSHEKRFRETRDTVAYFSRLLDCPHFYVHFQSFLYGIDYFLARKLANVYITDIAVGSLSSG